MDSSRLIGQDAEGVSFFFFTPSWCSDPWFSIAPLEQPVSYLHRKPQFSPCTYIWHDVYIFSPVQFCRRPPARNNIMHSSQRAEVKQTHTTCWELWGSCFYRWLFIDVSPLFICFRVLNKMFSLFLKREKNENCVLSYIGIHNLWVKTVTIFFKRKKDHEFFVLRWWLT